MKTNQTPRSGFTLIELLTVIAIIGILAAILIPAVGKVREVANKSKSSANIRSIAVSYATYSTSGGRIRTISKKNLQDTNSGENVHGVAEFLARNVDLTDVSIWIIDSDPAVASFTDELPVVVGFRDSQNIFQRSPEWTTSVPVGYDFAIAISGNAPSTTTPLLWTRGLNSSGTWGKDTPWGLGGHIAYLDGHVSFYNELGDEDGQLVDPNTGALTTDINNVHEETNIMRAPDFTS
ncbi:MAG: prepilin-type N-terminal cleavage/methylation domain-containing protein [Opitutales bacterium]